MPKMAKQIFDPIKIDLGINETNSPNLIAQKIS